ncbi:MAG: hypothetical protein U0359_39375 [Byssovorax sp.]
MRPLRLAGWAGIVFSILSLIVIPLVVTPMTPAPVLGSSGAEIAAWYTAHRMGFLVGNYLGIAAFVPGFVQLAVLAARVRKAEGEDGFLGALVLSTGIFAYTVFACSLVVFQVLPFLTDPAEARALGWLGSVWFSLDGLAALPFVLSVGWAVGRTGALPRWIAPASWAVAVVALVMSFGSLTMAPGWLAGGGLATFAGFFLFFVWTGALGAAMLRIEA